MARGRLPFRGIRGRGREPYHIYNNIDINKVNKINFNGSGVGVGSGAYMI